jgi:hypothetical protein
MNIMGYFSFWWPKFVVHSYIFDLFLGNCNWGGGLNNMNIRGIGAVFSGPETSYSVTC